MLHDALLLLPDFALIALGWALARTPAFSREMWAGVERLVYYVLFPALLLSTSWRGHYTLGGASRLLLAGVGALLGGIALAWLAFALPADRRCAASAVQCGFRFNSYIALAVADRVGGAPAVALVGVLIACGVPLCNGAAVLALARHAQRGLLRELARNPLIIATVCGLSLHAAGVDAPGPLTPALDRLGQASIALGLMTVGAGLQLRGLHREWPLTAWLMTVRHALLPLLAWLLARALGLDALQTLVVVLFGAMPTASSAYVLALRMGGDGPYVAGVVSLSTVLGAVSLPVVLLLLGAG